MTQLQQIDALIVGQGLAGTLLAWALIERGLVVVVVDDGFVTSSTRMAAGLLNPVTGMRFTRLRQADRFLAHAIPRYHALETAWKAAFFYAKPLLRIFNNEKQVALWNRRQALAEYTAYLGATLPASRVPAPIVAPFGAGQQLQTGYLNTPIFLDAARRQLQQRNALRVEKFAWSAVQQTAQGIRWQGLQCRWVIACEGYRGHTHPWFPWLPMRLSKGQIVTLQSEGLVPDVILNRGHWLLPVGGGQVRVGASYEREAVESGPTEVMSEQLLAAAHGFYGEHLRWDLIQATAGVRPGVLDKMPLVGMHPQYPGLGMFNGFGSKGVAMAPYYADCLVNHLLQGVPVPEEVSLQRWWNPHG